MVVYFYDCYQILKKVYSEKTFLKQAISSTSIQPSNRALVVKTCYGVLDKDIELNYYLSKLSDKQPKLPVKIILKIAIYCIKYLGKHDYAVIDNAVKFTKKLGKQGASGYVNAILRKFVSENIPFPNDYTDMLSVKYSYPAFAVENIIRNYGKDRAESILSSENKLTCVRFTSLNGQEYLQNNNIEFDNTPFSNVFICKNFVRNGDYDKGLYTFQSICSVNICDMIDGGENLLDCCAAPGGKSVNLSSKFKNVVACELYKHRADLICDYATRMHVSNITVNNLDMTVLQKSFVNSFDAVLVDAPCSGFGVVNDNPDIKLNREEKDISELNKVQLQLLRNASFYVKLNGYLYYSTCSLFYKENIDVLRQFMSDINNFEIISVRSKIPCDYIDGTVQMTPDKSFGQGFYFAKLKRIK